MSEQYTDEKVHLVINRLSRAKYDQLMADRLIEDNQVYMVTDAQIDANNAKVVNVDDPEHLKDAANKQYVDAQDATKVSLSSNATQEISSAIAIGGAFSVGGVTVHSDLSYRRGQMLSQSCMLQNRTFNYISLSANFESIPYEFEAPTLMDQQTVRDYLVQVKICEGPSGATKLPVISFSGLGDSLPVGDEYPTWEIGRVYDLSFTEQPDGTWLLKVLDITPEV